MVQKKRSAETKAAPSAPAKARTEQHLVRRSLDRERQSQALPLYLTGFRPINLAV